MRGDLIQQYKIVNNIDKIKWHSASQSAPALKETGSAGFIRGHNYRLERAKVSSCESRHYFFKNRIVNTWNSLNPETVSAHTVDSFKAKLDNSSLIC